MQEIRGDAKHNCLGLLLIAVVKWDFKLQSHEKEKQTKGINMFDIGFTS